MIDRVGVADKDDSSESTNGKVLLASTNKNIADGRLPAIENKDSAD